MFNAGVFYAPLRRDEARRVARLSVISNPDADCGEREKERERDRERVAANATFIRTGDVKRGCELSPRGFPLSTIADLRRDGGDNVFCVLRSIVARLFYLATLPRKVIDTISRARHSRDAIPETAGSRPTGNIDCLVVVRTFPLVIPDI